MNRVKNLHITYMMDMSSIKLVLNDIRKNLIKEAISAQNKAYSPYSKFQVGAAIITKDGKIFTGCNIENSSYGLTICAERVALFKAVSEGHLDFEAIAISSSSGKPTFPCGACRQVLAEFNNKMKIYLVNDDKTYNLSDLLPHSFTKDQMK
jgi:cytidine deaminase